MRNNEFFKATLTLLCSLLWLTVQAQEPAEIESTPKTKNTNHALSANVSPGWITTEVFTPEGKHSWRTGIGYELGYRCLFKSGYGFGIDYAHSHTSYPSYHYDGHYSLDINYVGPAIVYGGNIGKQWIATVEAGMGYAHYNNGDESKSGFGTKWGVGVEYQLNKGIGIGIGIRHHVATFSKQENSYYDSDKYTNGFKRLSINAGLRIYL